MLILSNQTPFDIRLEELQGRYLYGIHKLSQANVEAPICDLYKANINEEDPEGNLEHDFIYQTRKKNIFFKTLSNNNFDEISMEKKIRNCRLQRFGKILKTNKYNVGGALVGFETLHAHLSLELKCLEYIEP